MFTDVEAKLKRKNQILFSRDSECLKPLIRLMELQTHRTLIMWALDAAKLTLEEFERKYPEEKRPQLCLRLSEDWARGRIKMKTAKRAILDAHAAAKDMDDKPYQALCHAIGHAGATVHVETHALGLVMYELTALVLRCGKESFQKPVTEKIAYYQDKLIYWQENTDKMDLEWADFLKDDKRVNKENLLNQKRRV